MLMHDLQHVSIARYDTVHLSFKTTLDDVKWSDSRRVDCVLYRCIHRLIILQACVAHILFKTTVEDIVWSHSRRVDCVHIILHAGIVHLIFYHCRPQWMIVNGRTVGGLSVLVCRQTHSPHDIIQ